MTDRAKFFDAMRSGKMLGPTLDQSEVDGLNAILDAMAGAPITYTAYALATAYKETAHSMQPVEEANWLSQDAANRYFFRMYDMQGSRPDVARRLGNTVPGDGVKFHGRGYPQITGRRNYQLASDKIGVDLIENPTLALRADIAAKIMRRGMTEGWFTTKSFSSYLPSTGLGVSAQFVTSRYIINGQDCAAEIAGYALQFQAALVAAGWA